MSAAYVTVTGSFDDGSGAPLAGTAVFIPTATVYDSGAPLVSAAVPVQALITSGNLTALDGSPLQLLATDSAVTVEGPSPVWLWQVTVSLGDGALTDSWSFALPSSPSSVSLYATRNP